MNQVIFVPYCIYPNFPHLIVYILLKPFECNLESLSSLSLTDTLPDNVTSTCSQAAWSSLLQVYFKSIRMQSGKLFHTNKGVHMNMNIRLLLYFCRHFTFSCHISFRIIYVLFFCFRLFSLCFWIKNQNSFKISKVKINTCVLHISMYVRYKRYKIIIIAVCKDSYLIYACGFDRMGKWWGFCHMSKHDVNIVTSWLPGSIIL